MLGTNLASPHSDGHWISDRVNRTVELIKQYDPNLDVKWIPPENREEGDEPFIITSKDANGKEYVVFAIADEQFMDERILERILMYDASKRGDILNEMDARNQAKRAMILKEKQDEMDEAHDIAHHILKSPLTRYKHNGVVYE